MRAADKNTTFFLGAGFSNAIGAPVQSALLKEVLNYKGQNYNNPIQDYQQRLKAFLADAFFLSDKQMENFNLEDFYTPIDKCIAERSSFRGYSTEYITQIKNELSILIGIVIDDGLVRSNKSRAFMHSLFRIIHTNTDNPFQRGKPDINVITTNWDIAFDSIVFRSGPIATDIDYGTRYYLLNPDELGDDQPNRIYPREGVFNYKILKLHGSLNWLKCPSCNKLFINPLVKIAIKDQTLSYDCRFCKKNHRIAKTEAKGYNLEPHIVYPTFLKDLNSIHLRSIWEKSADVLIKTKRLIFIGYSFPQADYEIRQLLARRVPDDCEIICVLKGSKPQKDDNYWQTPQARYETFFGSREMKFDYSGAEKFILKELETYDLTTT